MKISKVKNGADGVTKGATKVMASVGNLPAKEGAGAKTSGMKMRGTGCATKGTMSRGPMA